MRIKCEIQINNRRLPSLNLKNVNKRGSCSSLALGRQPGSKADVSSLYLHVCTSQNKHGNKYKVAGNVEAVFAKFIAEGKFTIRLKEPPIDLCVKAEIVHAKAFIQIFKQSFQNNGIDKLHLSSLAPIKQSQVEKPKTVLTVSARQDYPITAAFPHSLERLKINGIDLNRIENRILKLKKLKLLDISSNLIEELPSLLSSMSALTVLCLKSNLISTIDPKLFTGCLKRNLVSLNLSDNKLTVLPHSIGSLLKLHTLCLNNNQLSHLPMSIGRLNNLRVLEVRDNLLQDIPAVISFSHFENLSVAGNKFSNSEPTCVANHMLRGACSLKEIVSRCCIKNRMKPTASDIPSTLVNYLDTWNRCICRRVCFKSHILARMPVNLKTFVDTVEFDSVTGTEVPGLFTLCSYKCAEKYKLLNLS